MGKEAKLVREKVLARYLLGELSEAEQVRLEERAFADPRLVAEIAGVEDDLIDEYVRGELSPAQRRRFESRFLASAARRQRVEFARALSRVVAASRGSVPPVKVGWRPGRFAWLGGLPAGLGLATAASLILLLGLSWLAVERVRWRAQVAHSSADLATLHRPEESPREEAAPAHASSADPADQLAPERQRREELARGEVDDGGRRGSTAASSLAVLFLPPGVGRGAAGLPRLVLSEAASSQAQLLIGLEPEDEYDSFAVELRGHAGQAAWTAQGLFARQSSAGRVIDLMVPEDVLEAGECELRLMGTSGVGGTEDVRYYYFVASRE